MENLRERIERWLDGDYTYRIYTRFGESALEEEEMKEAIGIILAKHGCQINDAAMEDLIDLFAAERQATEEVVADSYRD